MPHSFETVEELLILLAASVPMALLCHRFKLPTIVGFMLTGMIIGPFGLQLIQDVHNVEFLAEVGVILLLFTIGLEFSLPRLLLMRREVFAAGGLQVALAVGAGMAAGLQLGFSFPLSVLVGFFIALSSTAVVLKTLAERGEVDSPHGRVSVGILLFQDLCIVPMMLLVPILAGQSGALAASLASVLLKAVLVIGGTILVARFVVPHLLHQIVRTRSSEAFIIFVVLVALGTSLLTAKAGLSLALGAFLAGLLLAESDYSHQIVAEMLPFRDVFNSIFFVSVGMLLSLQTVWANPIEIFLWFAGIVAGKAIVTGAVCRLLRFPRRVSLIAALSLAQVGEFAFILAKMSLDAGLVRQDLYHTLVAVSVLSMLVTPFLVRLSPRISAAVFTRYGEEPVDQRIEEEGTKLSDHVIVVGYGMNGRNMHRVLERNQIPHIILELNGDTVRKAKSEGVPIFYGDAMRKEVLSAAGIERARVAVVGISDPSATRHVTKLLRQLNDSIHIIVRTRYVLEVNELQQLGANQVIPEEFETSIEIFSRVLREYHISRAVIQQEIDRIRSKSYQMFRSPSHAVSELAALRQKIGKSATEVVAVEEGSEGSGKTLAQLDLRNLTGATVIAAVRDGDVSTNPGNGFTVTAGDILVLFGKTESLERAMELFRAPRAADIALEVE